ncbi:Cloroperoxidase, partial [Microthyrium microscopicum]
WIPASKIPDARRAPCPLLNTLANHGFISRDGKGITKTNFTDGIATALNVDPSFAAIITNGAIGALGAPANESASFSLDQLDVHDVDEHDASLTRLDKIQGQTLTVQPSLVDALLADSDTGFITTNSLAISRVRREKESVAAGSPPLSDHFVGVSLGEAAFVLLVTGLGEGAARQAKKDIVKAWLDEERFPVELGYQRS